MMVRNMFALPSLPLALLLCVSHPRITPAQGWATGTPTLRSTEAAATTRTNGGAFRRSAAPPPTSTALCAAQKQQQQQQQQGPGVGETGAAFSDDFVRTAAGRLLKLQAMNAQNGRIVLLLSKEGRDGLDQNQWIQCLSLHRRITEREDKLQKMFTSIQQERPPVAPEAERRIEELSSEIQTEFGIINRIVSKDNRAADNNKAVDKLKGKDIGEAGAAVVDFGRVAERLQKLQAINSQNGRIVVLLSKEREELDGDEWIQCLSLHRQITDREGRLQEIVAGVQQEQRPVAPELERRMEELSSEIRSEFGAIYRIVYKDDKAGRKP